MRRLKLKNWKQKKQPKQKAHCGHMGKLRRDRQMTTMAQVKEVQQISHEWGIGFVLFISRQSITSVSEQSSQTGLNNHSCVPVKTEKWFANSYRLTGSTKLHSQLESIWYSNTSPKAGWDYTLINKNLDFVKQSQWRHSIREKNIKTWICEEDEARLSILKNLSAPNSFPQKKWMIF